MPAGSMIKDKTPIITIAIKIHNQTLRIIFFLVAVLSDNLSGMLKNLL
jgi:hypothetical protein